MKSGFTLIEILVAMAISGLLATMLMNTFFQVNTSTQLVTDISDMQMSASVLFHQLEKDLRGAYIPSSVLASLHSPTQKKEQKETDKNKENKEEEAVSEEGLEKKKELIPQVFVSKNGAGDMLEQVTFITDNPLVVYWGEKVGKPHQRRARVTYRVKSESDEDQPVSYRLMRYESAKFSNAPDEAQAGVVIVGDIKSITVMYRAREKEEPEKKDDDNTEKKSEKKQEKIEERNTWDTDEQIASDKEDQHIHLPNLVLIDITLWADDHEYAETFSYAIPLDIESAVIPAAIQKRKPAKKKEDKDGAAKKKMAAPKGTEEAKIKPMQQLFQKGSK